MPTKPVKQIALAEMRGLVPLHDRSGYSVEIGQVTPTNQRFTATGFRVEFDGSQVFMHFGWQPRFHKESPADQFALVATFYMTREGFLQFHRSLWVEPSLKQDRTFAVAILDVLDPRSKDFAENYTCPTSPPDDPIKAMREMPADVVSATLAQGRGYLEFLEISSEVARASRGAPLRDREPVRSLAYVVMELSLMYAFLLAVKRIADEIQIQHGANHGIAAPAEG